MELVNCSNCGSIYLKNPVRDCCDTCYKKEEADYDIVSQFLRKRENRAATMERVVEATGVEEALLHQWIRKGRLQTALFPNLGYPCDQCGKLIREGKLCETCAKSLKQELDIFEKDRERQAFNHKAVFHSQESGNGRR